MHIKDGMLVSKLTVAKDIYWSGELGEYTLAPPPKEHKEPAYIDESWDNETYSVMWHKGEQLSLSFKTEPDGVLTWVFLETSGPHDLERIMELANAGAFK